MAADAETCKGDVGGWNAKLVGRRPLALGSYRSQKNQGWRLSLRNEPESKGKNEGKKKGKEGGKKEKEGRKEAKRKEREPVYREIWVMFVSNYKSVVLEIIQVGR